MNVIGILLLLAGIVCVVLAFRRGGEQGTRLTEGPPPKKQPRALMGTGAGLIVLGALLLIVGSV